MDELKKRIFSKPILALPISEGRYILDTDASDFGLGAVLSQEQNGTEPVIAYASRTMNRAEQKYETMGKELLAIVYGLRQYKQYLLGRHFVIRTDHAALSRWVLPIYGNAVQIIGCVEWPNRCHSDGSLLSSNMIMRYCIDLELSTAMPMA